MILKKNLIAEFIGTTGLLIAVVGSGIMGENLSNGNTAVALLANSLTTGFALFVLIECFHPLSGAHINPAVTLYEWISKRIDTKKMFTYWLAQFLGGIFGVWLVHLMFDLTIFQISTKQRTGLHLGISEFIATVGLLLTIKLIEKNRPQIVSVAVASYIAGAYWFTSSTSFANPAVTIARTFTDTFCGIAPNGIGTFLIAQVLAVVTTYKIQNSFFK